jgi:hypothetical protein
MPTPSSNFSPFADRLRRRWAHLTGHFSMRRWWRRHMTRESLSSALRTFAWVAPLTVLIWVYAEREQLALDPNMQVMIEVRSADPNRIVRLIDPSNSVVRASLRGPRSRLDALRSELSRPGGSVQVPLDGTLSPGEQHQLPAANYLGARPIFADSGVEVLKTDPPNLRVFIDTFEEVNVEVQVPPEVQERIANAVFTPSAIRVRGPRNVLEQALSQGELVAYADLVGSEILVTPGTHELPTLRVTTRLRGENISLNPNTVRGVVEVQQANVRHVIRSMVVTVKMPQRLQERFVVKTDELIFNVPVIGPPDEIRRIETEQAAPPEAVLNVVSSDAENPSPRRRLRYTLPPGIAPEGPEQEIDFKLIPRPPAE